MKFDYSVTPIYRKDDFAKIKIDKFKPLVSIITPFYNSGKFIKDTAISVLNHTFPWFEWIIVDDGSKDKKSLDILSKIEKDASPLTRIIPIPPWAIAVAIAAMVSK